MQFNSLPFKLGAHISWQKSFHQTLKYAINNGMECFQCFMGSPKSFKRSTIQTNDIFQTKKLLERYPCQIFTHAPYLYNLAGSKGSAAWNGDCTQDRKTQNVLYSLEYELECTANFKGGVIVHPGNHMDRIKGLHAIAQSINKINFPENSSLLLENSAGQGTSLATTLDELEIIYNLINDEKKKNIGFCIDTAHIFGYGDYDLTQSTEVERLFKEFHEKFTLNKLKLIHLNDSLVKLGSKKDRHALIGTGYIWGKSTASLATLCALCTKFSVPLVLETDPSDMDKMLRIFN